MAASTRTFEVHDFDAVELRWFGNLVVTQGETEGLEVEGDSELVEKVSARVEGGTLVLELGQDWFERLIDGFRFLGRRALTYRLNVKKLRRVGISGSGTLQCASLDAEEFSIALSGQGNVRLDQLTARELNVRISGRGEIEAKGTVEEERIEITGSGDVELTGLAAKRARIRISGHGEAELKVQDDLDVAISGYGRVRYVGEPRLHQAIAGAGSVKQLGA